MHIRKGNLMKHTSLSTDRKKLRQLVAFAIVAGVAASGSFAQESAKVATAPAAEPASAKERWLEKLPDPIKDGKLIFNARVRYEYADQRGFKQSHAFTERIRLGYQTAEWHGFSALADFEDIRVIGSKRNANFAGLNGEPFRTVVADPEATELNRGWIGYSRWNNTLRYGRQRIKLDNDRFIGNVGWRQNEQTFDGVTFRNTCVTNLTLFYSYVQNVNRIFGDDHPAGDFDSNSHLVHASYSGIPFGTLTAYAYILDFNNAPAASCDTLGGSFVGAWKISDEAKLDYRAEYAHQTEGGNNPTDYDTSYCHFMLGGSYDRFNLGAGYEVLGSSGGAVGFQTPLATGHAFNGWADAFLATPGVGLEDLYFSAGVKLPYEIPLKAIYHYYSAASGGGELGNEINVIATRKFTKRLSALAKFAHYSGDGGFATRDKFWFQVDYNF